MSSMVWPCFAARVPMAVAMLPEPMMLIVVMTCVPLVVYESVGRASGVLGRVPKGSPNDSDHCGAAVGDQFHAVDVARIVRGQEQRDRRDLLRAAHLSPRDHGLELRLHFRVHDLLHHRRGDLAGDRKSVV